MATLYRLLLALNDIEGPDYFQAGDSSIKPGYVVERDDSDEVKIGTTSNLIPFGIAGCTSYHDLNTVWTETHRIPVWLCGSGVDVNVLYDDGSNAATFVRGWAMVMSKTDAGCIEVWANETSGLVGRLIEDVTISGNTPTFIPIKLSM